MSREDAQTLEDRILPWSQVRVICGLSRTTVWRLQKTGDFPASVQVSPNRVGWWQSDILEWRRTRIPRRLPAVTRAPKRLGRASSVRPDPMPSSPTGPQTSAPEVSSQTTPRRPRRLGVCENQTAFDF